MEFAVNTKCIAWINLWWLRYLFNQIMHHVFIEEKLIRIIQDIWEELIDYVINLNIYKQIVMWAI